MRKIILAVIAIVVIGVGIIVATTDTKEQKAAKLLASAQNYAGKGDTARAIVELRNALQDNPKLQPARDLYIELLLKTGRRAEAFGQYALILKQNPNDIAAMRQMAMIAFDGLAWDDARKYALQVLQKQPDDPEMRAISAGLDYRDAVINHNAVAQEEAAGVAGKLLAADPKLMRARRVVIARMIDQKQYDAALKLIDEGLAQDPDDREMNNNRLALLDRLGRKDEAEKQLLAMVQRYPKDEELGQNLVRFYVSLGRVDEAEKILRDHIDPDAANSKPRLVLMQFLAQVRSPQAMNDELTKVLAENPLPKDVASDLVQFKILKAQSDFVLGHQDQAISELEAMIKDQQPSAEIDRVKIELAKMRFQTGDPATEHKLVEEVLAHDPGQTEARKLKATWLIDGDQTDAAVTLLRDALADSPNDAQILSLLAQAYQREGRPELMAEMMSRAVQTSNQAPAESITYARYLIQRGEYSSTESILADALRRQPQNLDLLTLIAQTHMAMKNWVQVQQDIAVIAAIQNNPAATQAANALNVQLLAQEGRTDDLGQYLETLARDPNNALAAKTAMVRNSVVQGQLPLARSQAEDLVAQNPEDANLRLLLAQVKRTQGDIDGALSDLKAIVAAHPDNLGAVQMLQGMQLQQGNAPEALATLEAALKVQPESPGLLISKAIVLEKLSRIDDAIAIYDALYEKNSDSIVIANNLASLIASNKDDQASLDRAWVVARRLNGSNNPALQDTYGWLVFRRGDTATALPLLEAAAKGLPDDPAVAYHLGRAYAAQKDAAKAKAEYARSHALLDKGEIGYPALIDDLTRAEAAAN